MDDRYDVVWTSMWEEPIKFISVDHKEMEHLYKEGRNNQYKVDVYPRSMDEEEGNVVRDMHGFVVEGAWTFIQIPLYW